MLDMEMVDNTIEELENGDTNFTNCERLASLYTIKQFYKNQSEPVESELHDILPQYREYCKTKRRYQLKEISEAQVIDNLNLLCREIKEFIHTLYNNTDTQYERDIIEEMLKNIEIG